LAAPAPAPASLTLADVDAAAERVAGRVVVTPSVPWDGPELAERLVAGTNVVLKLELLQRTGSFKARGALLNVLALDDEARRRGLTAISAGNHAVAVAWAARAAGTHAKIVMIASANPYRVELTRRYGADVEFAATAHQGFARVAEVERTEGRTLIHPFDGRLTALGTAGVGRELMAQAPGLDAVVVPVGGGGLLAGVASVVKLVDRRCAVYGVEPEGADSMHRSLLAGEPRGIERVATIADSLGAPYALPYSFELCRRNTDDVVLVSDDALRYAMRLLQREAKLAVEPAGAATTAALLGPLRDRLAGKRVGLIVCGANIDSATYARLLAE
jgi:threonine dehydratase